MEVTGTERGEGPYDPVVNARFLKGGRERPRTRQRDLHVGSIDALSYVKGRYSNLGRPVDPDKP